MDQQDRHRRILRILTEHQVASVLQLAHWLGVSQPTVRRDLSLLDTAQLLRRTHGGAHRLGTNGGPGLQSTSFQGSVQHNADCKRAIARKAVELCSDGETVLIGGGTTTYQMVDFMLTRRLRVMTNSFAVARDLLANSENEVSLSGGKIYPEQGVILSPFETQSERYWYADHLFTGIYCLSSLGLMEADPLLIQAGRRLIPQAQQVTVLADSSKFAQRGGMFLCELDKIARVITDTGAPDASVQMLERAGVQVMLVEPEPAIPSITKRLPISGKH